jgi:hypothetical protein
MPDEKTTPPVEHDQNADGIILSLLTDCDEQRPWSVEEIAREYGNHGDTIDALSRLYAAGLIHRLGEFVWATRAAIRADEVRV